MMRYTAERRTMPASTTQNCCVCLSLGLLPRAQGLQGSGSTAAHLRSSKVGQVWNAAGELENTVRAEASGVH